MSKTVSRLKTDHRRMRNVLSALEAKVEELGHTVSDADADHLFCLIDYLAEYPDKIHHPLEDRVMLQLVQADHEQRERIDMLAGQHVDLKNRTRDLLTDVNALDSADALKAFKRDVLSYIELQREHMRFEEEKIFSLAQKILSSASWQHLDEEGATTEDPLFDKLERRYGAIYKYLTVDPLETAQHSLAEPLYKFLGATGLASGADRT